MDNKEKYILAMYDVRGIQNYIFRTPDLKSAIGASTLVEGIIETALKDAIEQEMQNGRILTTDLVWFEEECGPKQYVEDAYDIQILFIGGGNAFVIFRGKDLAVAINRKMAKYILEKTYALQLAVAMIEKSDDYQKDQADIRRKMEQVKRRISAATPFGATPAVRIDARTGYPITHLSGEEEYSTEAFNKKKTAEIKRRDYAEEEKLIDSLRTKKGVDSNVAVIHIDGNNLGLSIRSMLLDKKSYQEGVSAQRQLSYLIDHSYKSVFYDMKGYIEKYGSQSIDLKIKENDLYIIPVVLAGDDITYVCNGRVALESVNYFAKEISKRSMSADDDPLVRERYSFSICAGIAYANSHFPFHIAYDIAEECCESAKKTAKLPENMQDGKIGNWVDFHICRNIQARNLKEMRLREYVTGTGEVLLTRPYFIKGDHQTAGPVFDALGTSTQSISSLINSMSYFLTKVPRKISKQLRNTYPLGRYEVEQLKAFLISRGHNMPNQTYEMYDGTHAKWYDALELMDLFAQA